MFQSPEHIPKPGDPAKGLGTLREIEDQWNLMQNIQRTGEALLEGTKKKKKEHFVHTRTQEKGVVMPQETEPYLAASVQESPMETWGNSGLLRGQGH